MKKRWEQLQRMKGAKPKQGAKQKEIDAAKKCAAPTKESDADKKSTCTILQL